MQTTRGGHVFDLDPSPSAEHGNGPPGAKRFTRRQFVHLAVILPTALVLPAWGDEAPRPALSRIFFTNDEYRFIVAATGRLIPGDSKDPGAVEAQVPFFIDRQLGGPYGRADSWYMRGPWAKGTEQQGYQLQQTPAQLYRLAIAAVDEHCRQQYHKPFADLSAEQQDAVLHGLDEKKIDLGNVPAVAFFSILWQNTQEGFLADPMYGGNRNFVGWDLIGFPGPRYNYVHEITQYGKPYPYPPVGIMGRDGTRLNADI
jgi:gluconate 2-dehydrogenase gamma chain